MRTCRDCAHLATTTSFYGDSVFFVCRRNYFDVIILKDSSYDVLMSMAEFCPDYDEILH